MMHSPNNIEQLNAAGWQWALSRGKEQLGNLEANLRFIEKAHILQPGLKIHEVGCGIGTIVHHLLSQGCQASGSDIAANAIDYGKNKYPGIDLRVHSAEELPYEDESFDIVLSFDVLEHLFDVDKHLREIRRVLKKNGSYAFQTPNKYIHALYDTLRQRNLSWKIYHPSLQTPGKLKARLQKHGFSAQFYKMNPEAAFLAEKLGCFAFLARFISILPFEYLPLCLQMNLYVVAKKHENPDAQL